MKVADVYGARRVSTAELKSIGYPATKRADEKRNNPASYYVYRRLCWPVAWCAVRLGVSALSVTVIALLLTAASLGLAAASFPLLGLVGLNLACVLDQADGVVARGTGNVSLTGAWLDFVVGYACTTFTLGAMGVGLYEASENLGTLSLWLGVGGSLAIAFRKAINQAATAWAPTLGATFRSDGGGASRLVRALNSWSILLLTLGVLLSVGHYVVVALGAIQILFALASVVLIARSLRAQSTAD
jgi:phosphatidylglycerophosphate synthase